MDFGHNVKILEALINFKQIMVCLQKITVPAAYRKFVAVAKHI